MRILVTDDDGHDVACQGDFRHVKECCSLAFDWVAEGHPDQLVKVPMTTANNVVAIGTYRADFLREAWLDWARTWFTSDEPLDLRSKS